MSKPKAGEEVFVRGKVTATDDEDGAICVAFADVERGEGGQTQVWIAPADVLPTSALAAPQPSDRGRDRRLVSLALRHRSAHSLEVHIVEQVLREFDELEAALGKGA
jgi:hypothetical protein